MRNKTNDIVSNQVYEATHYLLIHKIPPEADINNYIEDIFQRTLNHLANHFLSSKKLRISEKLALETLQQDINKKRGPPIIEKNLYHNLSRIKPVWGEFFGTNRGDVYNAFQYLQTWPCFTASIRLQIKLKQQQSELSEKTTQLQQVGRSLKDNDQTTSKAAQRSASQFIQIQQLKMENETLKTKLTATETLVKQQSLKIEQSNAPNSNVLSPPGES